MRKFLGLLVCLGLFAVLGLGPTGCGKKDKKTSTGSSPATTTPVVVVTTPKTTTTGTPVEITPAITLAAEAVVVETEDKTGKGTSKITATRTKIDDEIVLTFTEVPKGVEIKDAKIKEKETEGSADVTVTDKAKDGEYTVKVKGAAGKVTADTTFKLTIKKKAAAAAPAKKITVTADNLEITPGADKKGSKKAKITITRENLEDEITLTFKTKAKGVTLPKDATIAKDATEAMVEVTLDDAKVGDHEVTITAAAGAVKGEGKLKLTVK